MTHLSYIVAAYVFGVVIPGSFAVSAFLRMRAAQRHLATVDTRRR